MQTITRLPSDHDDESEGLGDAWSGSLQRGRVTAILENGVICVATGRGAEVECEALESFATGPQALAIGDRLLFLPPAGEELGVVVGRITRYAPPSMLANRVIDASEGLLLRCGESSIDLRADGKVLIKGEDVTVRAKGTQRIRAGTVSIN